MATWKQIVLSLVILVAAAFGWVLFFPGAPQVLDRLGIEWAHASTPKPGSNAGSKAPGKAAEAGRVPTMVVAAAATTETINDRLQAIGTGRAKATVTVNPYSSGRMTELLVESGAHVEAGQVIARLDSDVEQIALDKAVAGRDDAKAKVDRLRALRASNAATAVQLSDAELELRNDELSVHDAQVSLDRRSVVSPIAGTVGILPIAAGNYVTSTSAIATVHDRSSILVDFWVPERFAAAVRIGAELTATSLASPKDVFKGTVSAIDNHIDEKSRTLWVQATIANPADSLRAGMAFQVGMKFPGNTYPAVSPLAIQWGADGAFIWVVKDGKAQSVPVRIIQRNSQTVLVDAPVAVGEMVVTEGVQSVRQGGAVRIADEDGAEQATVAAGS
ncbi:efflux RND transporter periplasmic adaptor subunit [Mesorhizobium sp. 8]|uniref:efflux RND transporter periplasmic adaptor subunit n=1 Tax=Mesorhizobium sp. 8 TaxID=2584466 RepID=UPI00111E20A2|nr:efflux RND transporter periplasmic adaptor subunit [Mesorhizobium sp. 8]QDC00626.1 efflux RND transporter periplasmic adaptor subunit [Mesorhizobium sp. 8]